ncbi:unnamed protein product [Calypogeia fissa]
MGQQKDATVVLVNPTDGVYQVCEKYWVVGPRYKLHEHVGAGSYGDVCKATDMETLEIVALKRIPDVFFCHMLAKRVLREVCIMRRLRHPYIISLSNVFTSGNLEIQGGVDLYIATEFADGGDMYHLKKPMQQDQVQLLIWQLLSGVRYLHSCHVWHRDIKSENVLLSSMTDVKICDFGLSRSAMEQSNMEPRRVPTTGRRSTSRKPVLRRQYTKTVVTPSYRAPEVIMSQGQYSSAIDIWALGCIFWELLDRQLCSSRTGPPPRPLFGVRGEPNTPVEGEVYSEDGNSKLSEQLDVIFDVIGTPCWKDIESVPSEQWRSYLKQIPGRAGNLVANLTGVVDEEALDLLSRMLAFDPARRCTAEEALTHTYFKTLQHPQDLPPVSFEDAPSALPEDPVWLTNEPAVALGLLEKQLEQSTSQPDGGRHTLEWLLQREVETQQVQLKRRKAVMDKIVAKAASEMMARSPALQLFPAPEVYAPAVVNSQLVPSATDYQSEWQYGSSNGTDASGLTLEVSQTVDAPEVQEPPMKKARARKKTIIKQGSLQIELNSVPSPQGSRTSSRIAKQKGVGGGEIQFQVPPVSEILPRRSPRLREIHAQGELPHRKRVCLRG